MQENITISFPNNSDLVKDNTSLESSLEDSSQINVNGLDHSNSGLIFSDASISETINDSLNQSLEVQPYEPDAVIKISNLSSQQETSNSIIPQSVSASVTASNNELDSVTGMDMNNSISAVGSDITDEYQQSADVTKEWISDFYRWNGDGKPSEDVFKDSNNKFATLNLGSNNSDGEKGIKFDWGDGYILNDNNLLNDNFAVRSYTQDDFEKGKKYKAKVRADDGYQLFAKNIITNEWLHFTPENEWKTDAYGAHKEIEFEVDESGVYDIHFLYFEGGGNAYFNLSWEEVNSPSLSYFTGKVDSEILNIRTSPSVKANISNEPLQLGNDVTFDAWANGGKYQLPNGEIKDEWYRIKGTSDWVAGAYIDSRPNNTIPKLELDSDNFAEALNFTLEREGGYVNDPDDLGGATNKGITQSTYNQYRTGLGLEIREVKSITDEEVSDIYFDSYWLASSSEELSEKLAVAHFDASVNHGVGKAKEILEEALASDGDEMNQVNKYLDIREEYYYYLVEQRPINEKFLEGWLNRINALRDFLA